jgi:hypothetical protein
VGLPSLSRMGTRPEAWSGPHWFGLPFSRSRVGVSWAHPRPHRGLSFCSAARGRVKPGPLCLHSSGTSVRPLVRHLVLEQKKSGVVTPDGRPLLRGVFKPTVPAGRRANRVPVGGGASPFPRAGGKPRRMGERAPKGRSGVRPFPHGNDPSRRFFFSLRLFARRDGRPPRPPPLPLRDFG